MNVNKNAKQVNLIRIKENRNFEIQYFFEFGTEKLCRKMSDDGQSK
ncbi:unnamed protein product [Paramecium pentaurelia]|uniref:Uncharacterized protein n=1 Tax=Paramecium pentaurelia TaxID=43138 RepID=A0A8S1X1Z9_9CILI|nr:unnamed protein product [Paramecium pentaurelia]